MKKTYDHSFHAYIKGIILIGFALLMLGLVLSGNLIYYIAPTMHPFVYFAMVTFFILGIIQIFRSTSKKDEHDHHCNCDHDHQIKGPPLVKLGIYSIFILPILFGFILPDRALNSDFAANRGIQYGSGLTITPASAQSSEIIEDDDVASSQVYDEEANNDLVDEEVNNLSRAEAFLEDPEAYYESQGLGSEEDDIEHYQIEDLYDQDWFNDFYSQFAAELEHEDIITVTEENYLDVMTVLDLYLDRFIGKEIEIVGFVFREDDFDDNEIVVARFAMTCCTADAGVYGTLVESSEADQFDMDTWVYARGEIIKGEYMGFQIPIVTNSILREVEEPSTPYVYPSFNR
ncbi:TIGR03943 family protein [Evansella sp. AB-P1]|uniref:TIGR03943 family putative permease subunit n=1 Tax=Evansella sp. AB-P1 TaxID=3037653 RepID=UPI00241E3E54|nr:TIGR03943 family protein [Evansella sp. AB-P1]MDG5787693.1 TIGR03943 family protein [Evansella sp. AB-P1]